MILNGVKLWQKDDWEGEWPFTLAPMKQIVDEGLRFTAPVTFLVGENGSGKSTLIETIAEAYGLDVRGGHGGRMYGNQFQRSELSRMMTLDLSTFGTKLKRRNAQGFFLRAETAKGVFEYMSDAGVAGYGDKPIAEVSHGEGFLQVFEGRFAEPGLYLLDEPEAALSFQSCLALMEILHNVADNGSQVICATHSPVLAALPGAQILELSDNGINAPTWEDLLLVQHWRQFMQAPESYLRHMF